MVSLISCLSALAFRFHLFLSRPLLELRTNKRVVSVCDSMDSCLYLPIMACITNMTCCIAWNYQMAADGRDVDGIGYLIRTG